MLTNDETGDEADGEEVETVDAAVLHFGVVRLPPQHPKVRLLVWQQIGNQITLSA